MDEFMIWNTFLRVEKRKHVSLMGHPYTTCSVLFSNLANRQDWLPDGPSQTIRKLQNGEKRKSNLKAVFSFGRKFSLHQTLYRSSNNRRVWLQIWHYPWYYFGWVTQRSSTMQLHWYGQDWAICIQHAIFCISVTISENKLYEKDVVISMFKSLFLVQMILSQIFASNLVKILIFL